MLKVLQLGTCGPLYGAERWILALVRNLDPARVESHIAVIADEPGGDAPLLDAALAAGFRGHRIEAPGRVNLRAVPALRELIRQHRIDVVHSHGYKADLIALLGARGTAAKTLATPHGWSHDAGWKLRGMEAMDRVLFRWFDAVAPLSPDLAEGLRGGNVHLIPNGVDLTEIASAGLPPPELQALRAHGPVIGYAGQLIARKDLGTLLRAFAAWARKDASLVLVGEGDQRAELEALAASLAIAHRTHFTGFRPDRLEWIKGFDLFVLPSRVEGIPRCLMEAMALGVPVLASDIAGTRELVTHGETGLLFPAGDASALTTLLDPALDRETSEQRAQAGRQRIEQNYSGQAMARAYEGLFAALKSFTPTAR